MKQTATSVHGTLPVSARWVLGLATAALLVAACGCSGRSGPEVVAYTALDSEFSKPIFAEFADATAIEVRPKFDTEATKTVGLANAILAERKLPRCDVFWNNEILNTLRLEREGMLEPYSPPGAGAYPAMYRSPQGNWHGFAARARVLVVNTESVADADRPRSIRDLVDPKWRGKAGIAKPLFGTTATHAACLFAAWGDERAVEFFTALKRNGGRICAGNKDVALSVGAGRLAFGLTDTDDAIEEVESGRPVAIVYPDQEPGGLGTLMIPNTLAIIKDSPNPDEARRLIDFLLTPEVESKLSAGPSAQIPLHPSLRPPQRLGLPAGLQQMNVDFNAAAAKWDQAARFLREEFARGD